MDIHSLKTDIAKKNLKAQNPPQKNLILQTLKFMYNAVPCFLSL